MHLSSPYDPRNTTVEAFDDPKYKTFVADAAGFDAIAKGRWSPATEDGSFQEGYRRYGASKFFLIMMQHELQARLNTDEALSRICVIGVDPGAITTSTPRLVSWAPRVLISRILYPVVRLKPTNTTVTLSRAASDVLEAAFAAGEVGELPKDKYYKGSTPAETSEESRDAVKRQMVWKETVSMAGLKDGDTVLANWQ